MIRFWTQRRRTEFLSRCVVDTSDRAAGVDAVRSMVRSWGDVLPHRHRGVDLLPLLVHKVAGYNVSAQMWAERALASQRGARAFMNRAALLHTAPGLYPEEHFAYTARRARGGSVVFMRGASRAVRTMLRHHPPRLGQAGYEPMELELPSSALPGRSARRRPTDVLLVGTMENYLNVLAPLGERLRERGVRCATLMPSAARCWRRFGRDDDPSIEESVDGAVLEIRRRYERECADAWDRRQDEIASRCVVGASSLWELIREDVGHMVTRYLPHAAACVEIGFRTAASCGARGVACARLRRVTDSAIVAGCRAAGAGVVLIPHGHIGDSPEREFGDGSFDRADLVLIWGELQRRVLACKRYGPSRACRVVAVGNPDWDTLSDNAQEREAARLRVSASLGFGRGEAVVTYCTQPQTGGQFGVVLQAVNWSPGVQLVVKVHPGESAAWYARVCAGRPRVHVVPHAEAGLSLHELLRASDAAVMFSSTANLEAMLLGTPVITLVTGAVAGLDRLMCPERFGLPIATDEGTLASLLASVTSDPSAFRSGLSGAMRSCVSDCLVTGTGATAADRAADEVAGLLARRSAHAA